MKITDEAVEAFTQYRRKQIAELRPYQNGEDMIGVSISAEDYKRGSPKSGDMIARNPKNHADQWLVAAAYFAENFEPIDALSPAPVGVTDEMVEKAAKELWPSVSPTWDEALNSPDSSHNGYKVAYCLQKARKAITAALASHEPAPTDTQEALSEAGEVVAFLVDCPVHPALEFANVHVPSAATPLVRQSALTACQQKMERLRAELNMWRASSVSNYRHDQIVARNAELVKALEPFAAVAGGWDGQPAGATALIIFLEWNDEPEAVPNVLVEDFRRARAVLEQGKVDAG